MVQWDETSAIIGVVSILFVIVLSPYGPTFLAILKRLLLRLVWPSRVQCASLCWNDIPEGVTTQPNVGRQGGHTVHQEDDDSENPKDGCLASSYGSVFHNAWIDPTRCRKRVPKPADLATGTSYIRCDLMTMKAFMLAHQWHSDESGQSCFTFMLVGQTLTAHYSTMDGIGGTLLEVPFTKRELQLLLEGHPPFYRESHRLPTGMYVRNLSKIIETSS